MQNIINALSALQSVKDHLYQIGGKDLEKNLNSLKPVFDSLLVELRGQIFPPNVAGGTIKLNAEEKAQLFKDHGSIVPTVRLLRVRLNLGLKEAKNAVEQFRAENMYQYGHVSNNVWYPK